jgi:fimbrial chaperone protein
MRATSFLAGAALALASWQALPYAFGVSPIRLDLSATARSGAISVANDDQVALSFQMKLLRWTQNDKGEDLYEDSKDLVYFPRLMSVESKQKRVIRVGTQAPPAPEELTYRLAIEEMTPLEEGARGPAVAVRMRFAVPIFVAPLAPVTKTEVLNLAVARGEVRFTVANTGNQHVRVEAARLLRGERVVGEVAGWYILAGARRGFVLPVPADECGKPGVLTLAIKGEGIDLQREVTVDAGHCRP